MLPSTCGLSHYTQQTPSTSVSSCPGDGDKAVPACFLWGQGPHRGGRCSRAVCDPSSLHLQSLQMGRQPSTGRSAVDCCLTPAGFRHWI